MTECPTGYTCCALPVISASIAASSLVGQSPRRPLARLAEIKEAEMDELFTFVGIESRMQTFSDG